MRELTITELKPLFEEFGLGPNFQNLTLIREIARLRATVAAQSPVVDAAKAFDDDPVTYQPELDLRAAVATLRAQEQK
jgi:hypothetical protein